MAKKNNSVKSKSAAAPQAQAAASRVPAADPAVVGAAVSATTAVRNSPIPKVAPAAAAAPARKDPTRGQIALQAYYISLSGQGGSEQDNWFRAERELRGL